MTKTITINEFVDELLKRINDAKTIDCCKEEIQNFSLIAKKYIGDKSIEVNWKE